MTRVAMHFLRITGAMSLVSGVVYMITPGLLLEPAGVRGLENSQLADIRAVYGGFQLGWGSYLVWSSRAIGRYRDAVFCCALVFGAVFGCRVIGVAAACAVGRRHDHNLVPRKLSKISVHGLKSTLASTVTSFPISSPTLSLL